MSVRVLTLFGEEIVPEQMNAVGRPPKTKKAKATPEEEQEEAAEEPAPTSAVTEADTQQPEGAEPANITAAQQVNAQPVKIPGTATPKKAVLKRRTPAAPEKEQPQTEAPAAETTDYLDGWAGDKQYYTIGEVSKLFKVNTSHIRFWTNEFELKVRTTRKGDRLYSPDQVREIRGIFHLVKEKKYTISGAKAKLKEKNVSVQAIDLKKSLLHLRNKLLTIRNQLS